MDKITHWAGETAQGVACHSLFGSAGAFEKTAGAPPFADWETGDELRKYIRTITADDRKKYVFVLVNALGAGEFYGSNINADWFGWDALAHEGEDYGYRTFLNAHAFQHHVNKDPERAFGVPVVSALNSRMKRVELIVRLDRELARRHGATAVVERIERGEFPDVSMGCRVPFDVCSICQNKSKTRDDYCEHMRPPPELRDIFGPNKILSDGQRIFVRNLTPRFFDISFVFIGADKCAKVMAKLAAKGSQLCVGSVCAVPMEKSAAFVQVPSLYDSRGRAIQKTASAESGDGMRGPCGKLCSTCDDCGPCHDGKLASAFGVKMAAHRKLSEMVKQIPSNQFTVKTLPRLERNEPDIKREKLDDLAEKNPLSRILGGATRLGIVLKPHEFQRLVLVRMGEKDFADKLDDEHSVFTPSRRFRDAEIGDVAGKVDAICDALRSYVKERTALGKPFFLRVTFTSEGAKNSLPTRKGVEHPLLHKVSAAYNGYRRNVLWKLSQVAEEALRDPRLKEEILGLGLSDMFSKTASAPVLSFDSIAYVLGAHFPHRDLLCNGANEAVALNEKWIRTADHASAQG